MTFEFVCRLREIGELMEKKFEEADDINKSEVLFGMPKTNFSNMQAVLLAKVINKSEVLFWNAKK